jgi:hypothetical protein
MTADVRPSDDRRVKRTNFLGGGRGNWLDEISPYVSGLRSPLGARFGHGDVRKNRIHQRFDAFVMDGANRKNLLETKL